MSRFLKNNQTFFSPSPVQPQSQAYDSSIFSKPFSLMLSSFDSDHNGQAQQHYDIKPYSLPDRLLSDTFYTLEKPQRHFEDFIDNSDGIPFIPKIQATKRMKSLFGNGSLLGNFLGGSNTSAIGGSSQCSFSSQHPYQQEIDSLNIETYKQQLVKLQVEILKQELTQKPLETVIVDSSDKLTEVMKDFHREKYLYLEYRDHTFRSYYGFICWLVIYLPASKRLYLIDAIKLRSHLIDFNQITTNKEIMIIVKEDQELTHLQRDFGVYLVNCVTTPHYMTQDSQCNIDWRVRPLTIEQINHLQKSIAAFQIQNDPLILFQKSQQLCMQLYDKPKTLIHTSYNKLEEQLFKWREELARFEDESVQFILPDVLLITLISKHEQISKPEDILELSKEVLDGYIPLYLYTNLLYIFSLINDYKQQQQQEAKFQDEKRTDTQEFTQEVQAFTVETNNTDLMITSPVKSQRLVLSNTKLPDTQQELFKILNWSQTKPSAFNSNSTATDMTTGLGTPEKQYHNILSKKLLTPSFFQDSVETKQNKLLLSGQHKNSSDKKSEESASSFKLNQEHCLNIFNSIKCFSERVPISSPEKRKYYSSLEQINERDEEQIRHMRQKIQGQYIDDEETHLQRILSEGPPQSLREIFKISNRNRKRNKQKKKSKFDSFSCESSDSGYSSGRGDGPIENVSQIVMGQYKQDAVEERNKENNGRQQNAYQQMKQMDDLEFMKFIGWIDQDRMTEMKQKQQQQQQMQQYQYQQQQQNNCNNNNSGYYYQNSYYGGQQSSYQSNTTNGYQQRKQPFQQNNTQVNGYSQKPYNPSYSQNSQQQQQQYKKSPNNPNGNYKSYNNNGNAKINSTNMIYSPKEFVKKRS